MHNFNIQSVVIIIKLEDVVFIVGGSFWRSKFYWLVMCLLEKAMAPHSSTFAWKIPWVEEPGRLQSMGSLRVGHDWVTSLSLSCIGEGNDNPLQCSCLENPRDGGAWWAAVSGVSQSQTRLKRLSSMCLLRFSTICSWMETIVKLEKGFS